MKRKSLKIGLTAGAVAVCVCLALAKGGPSKAPAFEAKDASGKTHSLKSLTAKGDVFLYFIKEDCPINARALPFYKRIGETYKGKAQLVGVFNGNAGLFEGWQRRNQVSFPVLMDPELKIIESYKAQASPWVIHVDKSGKIVKVWEGYSKQELEELNKAMAKAGKLQVAKLDWNGAPSTSTFG